MYTLEGVSSVANVINALMFIKCLNKTETPMFQSVVCFLFPKVIFLTLI